ncbi:MAG: acyl-protein synthetase, partial [Chthoniobacterales bacterium]
YGEHHFRSLRLYEAAATQGWKLAGPGGRQVLALLPTAAEAPHSSLSQMASWLCADEKAFFVRRGVGCWRELEEILAAATEPLALFGTALAFLDWFESPGDRTISLPAGTLAIETGGYKGTHRELPKTELYAQFTARLGLPQDAIVNEYGMTELSSQFYARGIGTPHMGPPWARGLVVNPETGSEVADGETGVLRLFDAANLWSVCAIQTQDLAIRRGKNFELIGRDPTALPRGCSRTADEMLGRSNK